MGTHFKGPENIVRALNAYIKLMRASESITADTIATVSAEKLTVGQFGALETLFHLGPMCQRELGAKLLRSGGNVTMVVDNLEKRGLVERVRDEKDRRYITVSLTLSGRSLIEKVFPVVANKITERFSVLATDKQEELERLLRKLGRDANVPAGKKKD